MFSSLFLFQLLTAVRTIRIVSVAFCLTVGTFLLFGQDHNNDSHYQNDRDHDSDPNEDTQSKRYATETAERAFILARSVHRGLFVGCLACVIGIFLCAAAV